MSDKNYLTIPELIKVIKENAKALEKGKLGIDDLTNMLQYSRDLNERIAILRYKALTENNSFDHDADTPTITEQQLFDEISTNKSKEEQKNTGFSLNFGEPEVGHQNKPVLEKSTEENKDLSVNEKLAVEKKTSVAEKLQQSKIDDLRTVIGINQKFLFMNDLFEGEKSHYDNVIDKINSLQSKNEVINFIDNEIVSKYNWDEGDESVQAFRALIDRKFA